MKHGQKPKKFSRESSQRKALLKSLCRNFLLKGKIKTTLAKAKETRSLAEKILTRAKKGDLASQRIILRYFSPSLTKKIIEEIAPQYKDRPGGYTRVIKLGKRNSDGAEMAIIELVK